jgi:hypothetical protein
MTTDTVSGSEWLGRGVSGWPGRNVATMSVGLSYTNRQRDSESIFTAGRTGFRQATGAFASLTRWAEVVIAISCP